MTSSDLEVGSRRPSVLAGARHRALRAFTPRPGYLVSPLVDFLCLGGASAILLPVMALLLPPSSIHHEVAIVAVVLAQLLNHPHFASSYQLFYDGFRGKAFGTAYPLGLRWRYRIAGIIIPVCLAVFLGASLHNGDARWLGWVANAMGLLVGWHYVKQGYGVLMVDAALKKRFFTAAEKRLLVCNAYICWIFAWVATNAAFYEADFQGLKYYLIAIPAAFLYLAGAAAAISTVAVIAMVARRALLNQSKLPLTGLMAYAVSIYLWILMVQVNPLFLLLTPAFHSLQYLLVAWRFRWSVESYRAEQSVGGGQVRLRRARLLGLVRFILIAVALGSVGFWLVPSAFHAAIDYDAEVFGPVVFLVICSLFINIHHFFIDNVIWRRNNPDVSKHLFQQP